MIVIIILLITRDSVLMTQWQKTLTSFSLSVCVRFPLDFQCIIFCIIIIIIIIINCHKWSYLVGHQMLWCFVQQRTNGVNQRWWERPYCLTLVPWQNGRCLTWDAMVLESLASSSRSETSSLPGLAAEAAAVRKDRRIPPSRWLTFSFQ